MSKAKEEKKEEVPSLDSQTELKMLSYTVTLKDMEIIDLRLRNKELREAIEKLDKETNEMKVNYVKTLKTEKTIRHMEELLEFAEKELERFKEEKRTKEREFHEEGDLLKQKRETEITKLTILLETYEKKMENVNNLQNIVEKQDEQIKQLEQDKDKLRSEVEERIKNKEIRNQIKFSELKKKMMENIQETQKNVTQLNIEYMDVSTKLTLLQNHQLLIELEYQSQQIEELMVKKENMEKRVFELTQDIEVHKEVELALAAKNKKYSETIKILERSTGTSRNVLGINPNEDENNNLSSGNINNINDSNSNVFKPVYINSGIREFTMVNNLEKKIMKLESALKKKGEDLSKLKNNFQFIEDKLKNYEKKYAGLFYLFEESLKRFADDEELVNNKDIYVNLENIKRGEFSFLSNNEQYSVIILLMKYLIPLMNPNDLRGSDSIVGNNLDGVNIKYHMSRKYKEDPVLKKVFSTNKNTMMQSIKKSLENLPMINSVGMNGAKKTLLLSSSDHHKISKSLI